MQLQDKHRKSVASLSPEQLDALAQVARLLGTVLRDDKIAEGAMFFYEQLVNIYNKQKKAQEKKEEPKKETLTWANLLKNLPGF